MLLDEPTLGLAPLVFREIFRIIEALRREGQTILMVEQNAAKALEISDTPSCSSWARTATRGRATSS